MSDFDYEPLSKRTSEQLLIGVMESNKKYSCTPQIKKNTQNPGKIALNGRSYNRKTS